MARRFLTSRGPSTPEDFAAWSSLSKTQAREALTALAVERATVSGRELLWAGDLDLEPWADPQVTLMNGYDEYVSSLSPQGKAWLDGDRLYRDRLGTPVALVMVNGQLAGHWRRTLAGSRVNLSVLLLRPCTAAGRASLEDEANAYGDFLDLGPVALTFIS